MLTGLRIIDRMTASENIGDSPSGRRSALSVWAQNNRLAGTIAGLQDQLQKERHRCNIIERERDDFLAQLRAKREGMARVLDSYQIHSHAITTFKDPEWRVLLYGNLGDAVRIALRHAKGGE